MADERARHDQPDERFDGVAESDLTVEPVLRTFAPAPSRVDRDRIMFAAGESAANRSAGAGRTLLRCWQAATLLLGCSTLFLASTRTPGPQIAERRDAGDVADGIVEHDDGGVGVPRDEMVPGAPDREAVAEQRPIAPAPIRRRIDVREPRSVAVTADRGYLAMRRIALTEGIEALPPLGAAVASQATPLSYGRTRGTAFVAEPDRG